MKLDIEITASQLVQLAGALDRLAAAAKDVGAFQHELARFLHAIYASGLIEPYDWMTDVAERRGEFDDATALQRMDAERFHRTVIAHVRLDRLEDGHLMELAASGYLTAMAARARTLAAAV